MARVPPAITNMLTTSRSILLVEAVWHLRGWKTDGSETLSQEKEEEAEGKREVKDPG